MMRVKINNFHFNFNYLEPRVTSVDPRVDNIDGYMLTKPRTDSITKF